MSPYHEGGLGQAKESLYGREVLSLDRGQGTGARGNGVPLWPVTDQ